ncbi:MAG: hypothetical protein GWN07_03730, partial [Actinobacteria bacterium]|nr:hypothetical protein [Actinomycetota bacterium]NIS29241.1 hypothetical protein [Actinomycetota bacterium]NIT94822.1 hypothetical protein [Actinomycetota bacterium]NIU64634.1 hypothetical protein [Actinomycetota bacterium]NIV54949.1 hypothetical protein [Actinomycetota bacterium]
VEALELEDGSTRFDDEIADAVDRFRSDHGLSSSRSGGSPRGLVDAQAVDLMWAELEAAGTADGMRRLIRSLTIIRR